MITLCSAVIQWWARHGLSPQNVAYPYRETYWSRTRKWIVQKFLILIVSAVKICRQCLKIWFIFWGTLGLQPQWKFLASRQAVFGAFAGNSIFVSEFTKEQSSRCVLCFKIIKLESSTSVAAGRRGEGSGACARAARCRGRQLQGRKCGILKFGRFWRIGVCIADSDILHP